MSRSAKRADQFLPSDVFVITWEQKAVEQIPLIAHIVHRFGIGGLENGVVNLLNRLPPEKYRHVVVCLTDFTEFRHRIKRDDVEVVALHKGEGTYPSLYRPLWAALRRLRPAVVHTRNLATLEAQIPAYMLGAPCRVHGEHGRDVFDLHGLRRGYNMMRKCMRPLVHQYLAVSKDLEAWLNDTIGVPRRRISQIYNGVDTARFHPGKEGRSQLSRYLAVNESSIVIGTVGRMAAVKDQITLVKAFIQLVGSDPDYGRRIRLVLIGDGPLRAQAQSLLLEAGLSAMAWLPGDMDNVPDLMRAMDVFVLPSLGEGISNTILEAMSTGLPVVATRVGGNPELVEEGVTGRLVPPAQPQAMADVLRGYIMDPELRSRHGSSAREAVERRFSLEAMVSGYEEVYDRLLRSRFSRVNSGGKNAGIV